MNSSQNCRFCEIVDGKYHYNEVDEPFAANDAFIALASIGALVEGWTLIIPKAHQLSMRNFYSNPLFSDFVKSVIPNLTHQYGPLIAFEHGANTEGSITACGTDHAHLHLVPLGESLLPRLNASGLHWVKCKVSQIASKTGQNEYLFYCDLASKGHWQDPEGYLHVLEYPISQFFRRLIADRKGKTEVSDYKFFPHLDVALQTRRMLVSAFA